MGQAQGDGGQVMMPARGRGVKPGVTHGVHAFGRCVPQDAGDELLRGEVQPFGAPVAVVLVLQAHQRIAHEQGPLARQRPAFGVACQVQRDAAPAGMGCPDLDVPVLAVQPPEQARPVACRQRWRQPQPALIEQRAQRGQQLARIQAPQRLQGQAGTRRAWPASAAARATSPRR